MLHTRGEVPLDEQQLKVLEIVTRFASALSALGVITIITTFCVSRHFRNPMHRLIFINAFYNAFDVTCTMISVSGPKGGNLSALCQFQGFLNQMYVHQFHPLYFPSPVQYKPSSNRLGGSNTAGLAGFRLPTWPGRLSWLSTCGSSSSAATISNP
jgi:hypothetical protein